LLAVAAGLLTPESGQVCVAGRPLADLELDERRRLRARYIGLVFQHANLLTGLTAIENVALQAMLAGAAPGEAMRWAHALLERLDLTAVAGRRPESLSGGEEQRLAVARALVHRPAVVLADEPTASLDTVAGKQVAELLLRLGAAEGAAVVLATHDDRLAACATRRVALRDGRIPDGG
jgi:putative ABC transport system ATP-binding protein